MSECKCRPWFRSVFAQRYSTNGRLSGLECVESRRPLHDMTFAPSCRREPTCLLRGTNERRPREGWSKSESCCFFTQRPVSIKSFTCCRRGLYRAPAWISGSYYIHKRGRDILGVSTAVSNTWIDTSAASKRHTTRRTRHEMKLIFGLAALVSLTVGATWKPENVSFLISTRLSRR